MNTPQHILLIRLKSIGDVLFTLPAVHVVRENFPAAKLLFLVSREHAPLLRGFAEIDAVIPLDRAVYRSGNLISAASSTFGLLRVLRRENFSLAIDFQGYGETELLSWWSGAPRRWGCVYNRSRGWLYTRGIRLNGNIHPADDHLALLEESGLRPGKIRNEFVLPADALDEAQNAFAANNLDAARLTLFIQPFTSSPLKDWPLENFLALARHWQARGWQVLFGGGPSDRTALEPARAAGFPVSAGVPLLVTAGLMKFSTLVAGGDTGLLHLAVALGKRVLMIMGSNTPGSTHPFGHPEWAVTPSKGKTVSEIQTASVIEASARAFSEQAGSGFC
jgi:ADP-heptose:LPS heptosyltransferase